MTDTLPKAFQDYNLNPDFNAMFNGFSNAVSGTYLSMQNSKVVDQFKNFAKPFLLITVAMYAAGFVVCMILLPIVVIFPGLFLQMFSLIPYWSYSVTQRFVPRVHKNLFMDELRQINPPIAKELNKDMTEPKENARWWLPIFDDVRKSWHFTKYSLMLSVVSAIPFIGAVLAFIGQSILVADRLSWNLFSVYTESCKKMTYKQQKMWTRERKWALLGFTLPFAFVTSIPVVGPLILGFAQAAAAHLFVNVLYKMDKSVPMSNPLDEFSSPATKKVF